MLKDLFTKHPKSVGETYWQHFAVATRISARCLCASLFQAVHALLPFVSPPEKLGADSMKEFFEGVSPSNRKKKNL
ncbi:MAG: DUF6356 family protein [Candidatus Thorarchaeota archaeon]